MVKTFGIRRFGLCGLTLTIVLILAGCAAGLPATQSDAAVDLSVTAEPASETVAETTTMTDTADITTAAPSITTESNVSGAVTFQIVPEGTEARFSIYELLMGQDKTVIGRTSLVEGQITVDPANPSGATISPIQIDARDLTTDSGRRDGAIRRFVLQSNQDNYQYILFEPTSIEGLPESVAMGEPFEFTVIGDLTIRDVTKEERFTVTVTVNSVTELVGLGTTTLLRSDYGLTIPSVPSVANVAEEVPLEIEFTAVAN